MGYTIPKPRLSWSMIKESFAGEWVELVDCDWDWDRATPSRAQVRHYSSDRNELMRQIQCDGELEDAIVLYVGTAEAPLARALESAAV
jgi:hypothetical protein